jgi:hypothetical protein
LRRRRTELVLRHLHGASPLQIALSVGREFAWPLLGAAVLGVAAFALADVGGDAVVLHASP